MGVDVNIRPNDSWILGEQQESTENGPQAVGPVANCVAQGKILSEGENGNNGSCQSNGPGRGEKNDSNDHRDEYKSSQDASAGHGRTG